MTASDWGPDSPAQEGAVPASAVAQGATNTPNPPESAISSGNDGSGDLSPETVASLVALARVIDPDACDPPAKSLPVGEAAEVWRRQDTALLTARRVWEAGYRPPLSSAEAVAEADRLESIPANQELAAAIRVAMAGWQQSSEPAGRGVTDAFVYMANELISQGWRLVSDDEATVDRVARALFGDFDGVVDGMTFDEASEKTREAYRGRARAAVRALRDGGADRD